MAIDPVFVGVVDRSAGAQLFLDDGTGVRRPVPHVARNSKEGLSWGYVGNGPADAALSILKSETGNLDAAVERHEKFMRDVVAKFSLNEQFALPQSEVRAWLAEHGFEQPRTLERPGSATPPPTTDGQDPAADLDRAPVELAARTRSLEERERRVAQREARLDAMAITVGLVPEVEPAAWLPAEPVRRHLEALVFDSGDDIAEAARANGLDAGWASAVAAGSVSRVDVAHVRQVCEGMRCTPYDIWGATGARSIAHAYGPDEWPAVTEPLVNTLGVEPGVEPTVVARAPGADRPGALLAPAPELGPAAPELALDLGPEP